MVKSLRQEGVEASFQPPRTHQCTWRDSASPGWRCHITAGNHLAHAARLNRGVTHPQHAQLTLELAIGPYDRPICFAGWEGPGQGYLI